MERLSPSFHCPWLSVLAVLVVVGSIPPGDFFFVFFLENLLFFLTQRLVARDLGGFEKALDGSPLLGSGGGGATPKAALLARGTARFACAVWALGGAFFGVWEDSSRRT